MDASVLRGSDNDSARQIGSGVRCRTFILALALALTQVPVAAAHETASTTPLTQWHGLAVAVVGVLAVGLSVLSKRRSWLTPTRSLLGVFAGLAATVVGVIVFDGLAGDPTYSAASMPFPRSVYPLLSLSLALVIALATFVVGFLKWRTKPRYTFLGVLLGAWVAYPALVPGTASHSHPLGYAIVLGTPVLVGYIVWRDAGTVLAGVLRDPVARRFGIGVGLLVGLFFTSLSGYLSFFWEEGVPHETVVDVLPVIYQLVQWPTLEFAVPQVPLFGAVSPGLVVVVGTLSVLIGLNAAVIARQWRAEADAGLLQGTAGTGAVVGSCTCGCCGPLVAKVAVLAAGPSVAAPLYWLFIDPSSPLSSLFIVGSVGLFTGSLLYAIGHPAAPSETATGVPAD